VKYLQALAKHHAGELKGLLSNVRRSDFLEAEVSGNRCELRLVWRNAPMRVPLSREQAMQLIAEIERFARFEPEEP
jgi:hypothetical protein